MKANGRNLFATRKHLRIQVFFLCIKYPFKEKFYIWVHLLELQIKCGRENVYPLFLCSIV